MEEKLLKEQLKRSKNKDEYASKIFVTFIRILSHFSPQNPNIHRKL